MSGVLGNHFVTQIGILVNDIEKVSRAYADFWTGGAGNYHYRYGRYCPDPV